MRTACFKALLVVFLTSLLLVCPISSDTNVGSEEINQTVICTKDLIEVEIPSSFFLTKNPPIFISDLHLNDPECRGREVDDSYVFSIQTNFTDCGTIMGNPVRPTNSLRDYFQKDGPTTTCWFSLEKCGFDSAFYPFLGKFCVTKEYIEGELPENCGNINKPGMPKKLEASDDSHIVFINTIHSNSSDVVTRSYINITFACRYPVNYMVQQPNGESRISVDIRTIKLSTEDGNFSVSMMLYKDEAFQDMWTTVPSLKLEDNIFVRVYMIPGHLIIRLEKCWATPTNEPSHPVQYTFIQDSCSHVFLDETLSIIMNGVSAEAMFRIQMFKFVGLAYNNVFLHCSVQICHNTETICKPNCTNHRRVFRNKRELPEPHTVTYGPIQLNINDGAVDSARGKFISVETMILICVLAVVLVATGLFGKLIYNSRRSYPTMQAQLTLANIHHSEVAS